MTEEAANLIQVDKTDEKSLTTMDKVRIGILVFIGIGLSLNYAIPIFFTPSKLMGQPASNVAKAGVDPEEVWEDTPMLGRVLVMQGFFLWIQYMGLLLSVTFFLPQHNRILWKCFALMPALWQVFWYLAAVPHMAGDDHYGSWKNYFFAETLKVEVGLFAACVYMGWFSKD
eukprot:gnl/MRDRNA2_/MRDRNA2_290996_c0_seq1.p1 gnl/MRDRNA2_/MRDRNA2_290996_c0~~gnl/MRDRNA2_/MRDRNA2_290996_c0_seq1.p1  ORF type:complete len:171 (+),score=21.11 gnl/MRDRNA2_/MRDRNA2_290996_c0_seq1:136-648(+)